MKSIIDQDPSVDLKEYTEVNSRLIKQAKSFKEFGLVMKLDKN